MYFANRNSDSKDVIEALEVAGKKFPWVASAIHVGNTLNEDGTMEQDIKVKRAQFIDEVQNLQQEFHKCHPEVQAKLMTLYSSSCYGSNTWDLFGSWARKFYTSWNVNLRIVWDLPYATHRYFYEHLTDSKHLKVLLIKRFKKFVLSISDGTNSACKMLLYTCYRNVKSATGSNIRNIELEVNEKLLIENLQKSISKVVETLQFEETPATLTWRIAAMKETALVKLGHLNVEGFTTEEVEEILDYICTQ